MAEVLLLSVYFIVLAWVLCKIKPIASSGIRKRVIVLFFLFKLIAGLGMAYMYLHYYPPETADIYKYFNDGKIVKQAWDHNPLDFAKIITGTGSHDYLHDNYFVKMDFWYKAWERSFYNDNRTLIKWNGIVHLVSFGFFSIHVLFMSFLVTIGTVFLYLYFKTKVKIINALIFLLLTLTPSVFWWTSGPMKEALLVFALGLLLYQSMKIRPGDKILIPFIWVIMCIVLMFFVKVYVIGFILPFLLATVLIRFTKHKVWVYSGVVLSFFVLGMNLQHFLIKYPVLKQIQLKKNDFIAHSLDQNAGSFIETRTLEPTLISFFTSAPEALINVMIRPYIWEAKGALLVAASLENMLILVFLILCCIFAKKPPPELIPRLIMLFGAGLMILLLTGWTSPVFGAMVRYKVPALILILPGFAYLLNNNHPVLSKLNENKIIKKLFV